MSSQVLQTIAPAITPVSAYDASQPMAWQHFTGSARFDYPIDYWFAVLGYDRASGRMDFLSKWAPNSYCHYHRHLGPMSVLVLEGEQHIVETSGHETVHKVRRAGFFTRSPGGDVHMERGGPEGAVVLFMCQAVDGKLFEVLDRDDKVLATATIDSMLGESR
jgi:hypothetical protein